MKTASIFLAAMTIATLPAHAAEPLNGGPARARLDKAEPVGARTKVSGAQPCCAITSIDSAKGIVTLKDVKSGQLFKVNVQSKAKLSALRVGQNVDKNL